MKIFIFLTSLLFMQNAYAHEEHFTSNGLGYDHVRSLCVSGGDNFRATSLLCSDLRVHELAHSRTSTSGGFGIIFGGDDILRLSGDILYRALATIFLAIFSIMALMIGFRKLSAMFSGGGGGKDYYDIDGNNLGKGTEESQEDGGWVNVPPDGADLNQYSSDGTNLSNYEGQTPEQLEVRKNERA